MDRVERTKGWWMAEEGAVRPRVQSHHSRVSANSVRHLHSLRPGGAAFILQVRAHYFCRICDRYSSISPVNRLSDSFTDHLNIVSILTTLTFTPSFSFPAQLKFL